MDRVALGRTAVEPAVIVSRAVAVVLEKTEAVGGIETDLLQPYRAAVFGDDRMRVPAAGRVRRADDDDVADLFQVLRAAPVFQNAQMPRVDLLNRVAVVRATQRARVRPEYFVLRAVHLVRGRIAVEELDLVDLLVRGQPHDAPLREGQRIVIDGQAPHSQIRATRDVQRLRGLGADHLHPVGDERHIRQTLERQMPGVLRLHPVASRRHHDPLLSSLRPLVDVPLQIERGSRSALRDPAARATDHQPQNHNNRPSDSDPFVHRRVQTHR